MECLCDIDTYRKSYDDGMYQRFSLSVNSLAKCERELEEIYIPGLVDHPLCFLGIRSLHVASCTPDRLHNNLT